MNAGRLAKLTFVLLTATLFGLPLRAVGQPPAKVQPPAKTQPPAKGAEKPVENYYRDARVGDWVSYKTGTGPVGSAFKQTVTAKTADEITIKYEMKNGDMDFPATETKISLKEAFDPNKSTSPDVTSVTEKLGSGKETLTVDGKKYDCDWVKNKTTITSKPTSSPAMTTVMVQKMWTCKDVPLGGAVKIETEMSGQTNVMELTGCGRGK